MIADLEPYPIMSDSGVVWLGEVPKGWDVLRGRQLFEIKKRISGELGHPVISVTQEGLRVKDVESGEGQLSQDYSKYQTVGVGEFAMNSMDLLTGGVGIATSPGVTSPDYRVFAIRDESRCCDRYMLHVLRMLYRNRGFYAWGQGSAQLGRWRLPRKRFNDFPFPVPPFIEQAAIARFLDWANERLARAIRAKRKVIGLLNEQKQAIIHHAVTRGTEPSVPLKPSGIPWLGDIPQHWEVRRVKQVTRILRGKFSHRPRNDASLYDGRYPFIQTGVVAQSTKFITSYSQTLNEKGLAVSKLFPSGTLVMTIAANIGEVAVLAFDACFPDSIVGFVPSASADRDYLYMVFLCMKPELLREAPVNTQGNLNVERIGAMGMPFPPPGEQWQIAKRAEAETASFDVGIERLEREIKLLREYRARLVANVVTGKLDAREAAARLPDEASPADSAEDDTGLDDKTEAADEKAAV